MDVWIDAIGWRTYVDCGDRIRLAGEQRAIAVDHRPPETAVVDRPAVNSDPDVLAVRPCDRGVCENPLNIELAVGVVVAVGVEYGRMLQYGCLPGEISVVDAEQRAPWAIAARRERRCPIVTEREADIWANQRVVGDLIANPAELRGRPGKGLPAGRPVGEEIGDGDCCPLLAAGVANGRVAVLDAELCADSVAVAGDEFDRGTVTDRGQRFPTKAERRTADQRAGGVARSRAVAGVSRELACRVSLDGEFGVRPAESVAVVRDANPVGAVAVNGDIDPARTGVEGVVDEFAHDASGSADNLAGGDFGDCRLVESGDLIRHTVLTGSSTATGLAASGAACWGWRAHQRRI